MLPFCVNADLLYFRIHQLILSNNHAIDFYIFRTNVETQGSQGTHGPLEPRQTREPRVKPHKTRALRCTCHTVSEVESNLVCRLDDLTTAKWWYGLTLRAVSAVVASHF